MAIMRVIFKRDEHFLSFIVVCILFQHVQRFKTSFSVSSSSPSFVSSLPLIQMYAYILCSSQSPIRYIHIYIHRTYIMHRRSIIIVQVKRDGITAIVPTLYICIRPTLMQATSSLSHLFSSTYIIQ